MATTKSAAPRATKTAATKTAAPKSTSRASASVKAAAQSIPKVAATASAIKQAAAKPVRDASSVVTEVMNKVIDANPVGKAAKVTKKVARAVVKTRRAAQLNRAVRNKVIVVTGATAGIGEDTAIKLAKGGAIVILAARTPEKLEATMAKIKADGGKAFAYSCDISDMADCDRFVKTGNVEQQPGENGNIREGGAELHGGHKKVPRLDERRAGLILLHVAQLVGGDSHRRDARLGGCPLRQAHDIGPRVEVVRQVAGHNLERDIHQRCPLEQRLAHLTTRQAGAVAYFAPLAIGAFQIDLHAQRQEHGRQENVEQVILIEKAHFGVSSFK